MSRADGSGPGHEVIGATDHERAAVVAAIRLAGDADEPLLDALDRFRRTRRAALRRRPEHPS